MAELWIDGDYGNDRNDGLSELTPVRSPGALATVWNSLFGDVQKIHWKNRLDYANACLGNMSTFFFHPSYVGDTVENLVYPGTYFVYGCVYRAVDFSPGLSSTQKQIPLTLPSGNTIECVMIDWEQTWDHRHSDGRYYTDATLAASAAASSGVPYTWYHDGENLWVDFGSLPEANVIVIFRPETAIVFHQVTAYSWTYEALVPGSAYIVTPRYVATGLDHYWCQVAPVGASAPGPYGMQGFKADFAWHLFGLISGSAGVLFEYSSFTNSDNHICASFVTDQAAVSANPYVTYSNITGTLTTAGYYGRRNYFRWHRPMTYAGVTIAEGTGGGNTAYNHRVTAYLSHTGAGGTIAILNTGPMSLDEIHHVWDMEVTNPYLPQPNTQSLSAGVFAPASWSSYAVNLELRNRLPYNAAYNGLHYGLFFFNLDTNVCLVRPTLKLPDGNVLVNNSDPWLLFGETNGTNTRIEIMEPKIMLAGNSDGNFHRVIQLRGTTGEIVCRLRNPTIVSEATTLAQSVILLDISGASATAKFQVYNGLFHSNDTVNSLYFVMVYVATTSQIALYSSDPSDLVFENCWYSGFGASRYDVSGGGQRDTATEWAANSGDGPHDGTLGNGAGRDAKYTSAGTWNSSTEEFASTDAARTSTIDSGITLTYAPSIGNNQRAFSRHRGADQYQVNSRAKNLMLPHLGEDPMVASLYASITGNVTDQEMLRSTGDRTFRGGGIEAGGRIVLGTATSADVTVKDSTGRVLYSSTGVVANTTIDPAPRGVVGPLKVTVANISNAAHTLSVYWSVNE